jgi:hypothetical protein
MPNPYASITRWGLRRYRKKAARTLNEPVVADLLVKNLAISKDPKEWAAILGGAIMEAIIPIPEAFQRLSDLVLDQVTDSAIGALSARGKPASYVDVKEKFKSGEDLYLAVTPTRFAIFRLNPFTITVAKVLLIVPRSLLVGCSFGERLSIIKYPYDLKLVLIFPAEVALMFGVFRTLEPEGQRLQQTIQGKQPALQRHDQQQA